MNFLCHYPYFLRLCQFLRYLRLHYRHRGRPHGHLHWPARSIACARSRIVQERINLGYSLLVSVFKYCKACTFCLHKSLLELRCSVYLTYLGSQTDRYFYLKNLLSFFSGGRGYIFGPSHKPGGKFGMWTLFRGDRFLICPSWLKNPRSLPPNYK